MNAEKSIAIKSVQTDYYTIEGPQKEDSLFDISYLVYLVAIKTLTSESFVFGFGNPEERIRFLSATNLVSSTEQCTLLQPNGSLESNNNILTSVFKPKFFKNEVSEVSREDRIETASLIYDTKINRLMAAVFMTFATALTTRGKFVLFLTKLQVGKGEKGSTEAAHYDPLAAASSIIDPSAFAKSIHHCIKLYTQHIKECLLSGKSCTEVPSLRSHLNVLVDLKNSSLEDLNDSLIALESCFEKKFGQSELDKIFNKIENELQQESTILCIEENLLLKEEAEFLKDTYFQLSKNGTDVLGGVINQIIDYNIFEETIRGQAVKIGNLLALEKITYQEACSFFLNDLAYLTKMGRKSITGNLHFVKEINLLNKEFNCLVNELGLFSALQIENPNFDIISKLIILENKFIELEKNYKTFTPKKTPFITPKGIDFTNSLWENKILTSYVPLEETHRDVPVLHEVKSLLKGYFKSHKKFQDVLSAFVKGLTQSIENFSPQKTIFEILENEKPDNFKCILNKEFDVSQKKSDPLKKYIANNFSNVFDGIEDVKGNSIEKYVFLKDELKNMKDETISNELQEKRIYKFILKICDILPDLRADVKKIITSHLLTLILNFQNKKTQNCCLKDILKFLEKELLGTGKIWVSKEVKENNPKQNKVKTGLNTKCFENSKLSNFLGMVKAKNETFSISYPTPVHCMQNEITKKSDKSCTDSFFKDNQEFKFFFNKLYYHYTQKSLNRDSFIELFLGYSMDQIKAKIQIKDLDFEALINWIFPCMDSFFEEIKKNELSSVDKLRECFVKSFRDNSDLIFKCLYKLKDDDLRVIHDGFFDLLELDIFHSKKYFDNDAFTGILFKELSEKFKENKEFTQIFEANEDEIKENFSSGLIKINTNKDIEKSICELYFQCLKSVNTNLSFFDKKKTKDFNEIKKSVNDVIGKLILLPFLGKLDVKLIEKSFSKICEQKLMDSRTNTILNENREFFINLLSKSFEKIDNSDLQSFKKTIKKQIENEINVNSKTDDVLKKFKGSDYSSVLRKKIDKVDINSKTDHSLKKLKGCEYSFVLSKEDLKREIVSVLLPSVKHIKLIYDMFDGILNSNPCLINKLHLKEYNIDIDTVVYKKQDNQFGFFTESEVEGLGSIESKELSSDDKIILEEYRNKCKIALKLIDYLLNKLDVILKEEEPNQSEIEWIVNSMFANANLAEVASSTLFQKFHESITFGDIAGKDTEALKRHLETLNATQNDIEKRERALKKTGIKENQIEQINLEIKNLKKREKDTLFNLAPSIKLVDTNLIIQKIKDFLILLSNPEFEKDRQCFIECFKDRRDSWEKVFENPKNLDANPKNDVPTLMHQFNFIVNESQFFDTYDKAIEIAQEKLENNLKMLLTSSIDSIESEAGRESAKALPIEVLCFLASASIKKNQCMIDKLPNAQFPSGDNWTELSKNLKFEIVQNSNFIEPVWSKDTISTIEGFNIQEIWSNVSYQMKEFKKNRDLNGAIGEVAVIKVLKNKDASILK